jgi:hypothetical protein
VSFVCACVVTCVWCTQIHKDISAGGITSCLSAHAVVNYPACSVTSFWSMVHFTGAAVLGIVFFQAAKHPLWSNLPSQGFAGFHPCKGVCAAWYVCCWWSLGHPGTLGALLGYVAMLWCVVVCLPSYNESRVPQIPWGVRSQC